MTQNCEYLVSVRLMTYNHAKYIRDAIEGILRQKTNFAVEVVVGDDFSQDDTLNIIREYKSTENIHIRILDRQIGDAYWVRRQKLGRLYNFTNILDNCHGKYIALLDGDDFWPDPLKLQKQVDFLEANEDYVGCYHDVMVVDAQGALVRKSKNSAIHLHDYTSEALIRGRVMSVLSLCYRNVIKEYPEELFNVMLADKFLCSLLGHYGKGKYLADIQPAAYRLHNDGVWSLKNDQQKKMGLITSYFWMWKYYERLKMPEYSAYFFNMILREGFFSNPFKSDQAVWFDKIEYLIISYLRKAFALLRKSFRIPAIKKKKARQ